MKKIIYLTVLIAGFFSACSKDTVIEKIPEVTASFSRSFFFPRTSTTESVVTNSSSAITVNSAYNSTQALVIGLNVTLPSGIEQVGLIIKKDKIKSGLVGDYVISPFLTQGKPEGDIEVTYGFSKTPPATFFMLPGAADGVLHITGYDPNKKLVKGSVSFRINSDKDPRVATSTVWENTQIDVTGSFENVQIKP